VISARVRAVALALFVLPAEARASELGFAYVRANVGGGSGGHAALVAGDTVYHLQNDSEGLLELTRDHWTHFRYLYADLQNRPLRIARVEIDPEARERVLARFARLYVEQEMALAERDEARDDVAWLEASRDARAFPALSGAGLLAPERAEDPHAARLRDALAAEPDALRLAEAIAAAENALAASSVTGLHELRDALLLREALRALQSAWGLSDEALVRTPSDDDEPLSPAERDVLRALADQLERTVAELLHSTREDRGAAILLAQARYLAAWRSLDENRLVLLDPLDGAPPAPSDPFEMTPQGHAEALRYTSGVARRIRAEVLAGKAPDEASYNRLEQAGAVLERVANARELEALVDLARRRLPSRGRSVAVPVLAGDVGAALDAARERLALRDAELRQRYAYDLFSRNCITELVRTAEGAFGGRVSADEAFGFIPFVFFDRVRERLPVARVEDVPSHRERELARLEREEPGVWTRLRESTSLGSEIYTPRRQDGAFLLFTDDVFWRRPLYGVVNLAWAAGYTAYGVVAAPFDFGARAKAGLSGMFWSVPELAFENVRKGSFEWVTTQD
jgi:hypothetical protein